ncbi:MAG: hypothetical protein ACRDCA_12515 [Serratia sp. (in: enterobacteria)]|uniref:hypothetical protein n=1 Tax=Serratia sp. (in: enterobacteria) TaxID=616 RepID=UPI003F39CF16
MSEHMALVKAAQRGDALIFDDWEFNPGVIEMRKILRETRPNTSGRMSRAQLAFPPIKALYEKLNSRIKYLPVPKDLKTSLNNLGKLFDRIKTDKQYAILAYNTFPVLADRYGAGTRIDGKPRLSFVRMIDDPLARELLK